MICIYTEMGFLDGSVIKNLPANAFDAGDSGLIPGLGRSPGGGNGNPLEYSCLGNPTDRGIWQGTPCRVHGLQRSQIRLSTRAESAYIGIDISHIYI